MTTSSQQIQFRQRNRTYYADLERLHQLLVPPGLRVLEVGCGTGDLLAHLQPAHGVGIELDPEVAAVARERHPELRILATNAETMTPQSIGETQPFDVILLPNTLNTLQDDGITPVMKLEKQGLRPRHLTETRRPRRRCENYSASLARQNMREAETTTI